METRNVKVTLEKAREWYKSGNSTLKEIALQAFTEKELKKLTFSEISELVGPCNLFNREEIVLKTLAEYYKKSFDRFDAADQEKYFIGKNSYGAWGVIKHVTVLYPGIGYYIREKDAREALVIFLDEMNYTVV